MATTDLHFEKDLSRELPELATPAVGEHLWVNYYPEPGKKDFIALPVACIKVYEDGSWDGVLEEGEA